eukprot:TRINITY_DN73468_c0_g1_i1.p1 TRINITY_DN73468_c0_g1~~TRINITY_DN73468_c0_g1_i1.p1  ORF type:complete len:283 (-),score=49.15 TRINITY_DN73468_c0_g1_i1:50-898(-)
MGNAAVNCRPCQAQVTPVCIQYCEVDDQATCNKRCEGFPAPQCAQLMSFHEVQAVIRSAAADVDAKVCDGKCIAVADGDAHLQRAREQWAPPDDVVLLERDCAGAATIPLHPAAAAAEVQGQHVLVRRVPSPWAGTGQVDPWKEHHVDQAVNRPPSSKHDPVLIRAGRPLMNCFSKSDFTMPTDEEGVGPMLPRVGPGALRSRTPSGARLRFSSMAPTGPGISWAMSAQREFEGFREIDEEGGLVEQTASRPTASSPMSEDERSVGKVSDFKAEFTSEAPPL